MVRRALRTLIGTAAAVLIGACSTGAPAPSPSAIPTASPTAGPTASPVIEPPASASAAAGLDADLIQPGQLVMCISFPSTLFAEYDADGQPFGVDVEIGRALGAHLGLAPGIVDTPFEGLIDAVEQGRCDISIAGQFITSTRLERIDMIPYIEGAPHVIVRAGNQASINELTDLCGRSFAVVAGTVYVDLVHGDADYAGRGLDDQCIAASLPEVDLHEFPNQQAAEAALANGDVDAYAGNDFITTEQPDVFEFAVALPKLRDGIGHRLGLTTLDASLRDALRSIIADGTYLATLQKYGVESVRLTIQP
jgi:polar amino acid transport system substrate-binding protein